MDEHIKQIICDTFKRCYGLQHLVSKNLPQSLETLSYHSGIRLQYLKQHLEEINKIILN